ncbi:MAG: M1 family metallopeptidase [Taibaiella sp.]|nr:M1 family metallopeptidase [Taibaiella sp.]
MKKLLLLSALLYSAAGFGRGYSHADSLRGSDWPHRAWWDVLRYELTVDFDTVSQSISGSNRIIFLCGDDRTDSMQIDLQRPMELDSAFLITGNDGAPVSSKVKIVNENNVWWLKHPFSRLEKGAEASVLLYYHGTPRKAVNPPWDGGFSWKRDSLNRLWISVSCQGLGASVWWPCKDAQWDEPDNGMNITLSTPNGLQTVSNGVMTVNGLGGGKTTTEWEVRNPINNYDVTFYIGHYVEWHDTLMGEKGKLSLSYYVLDYNETRARKQFAVVKDMIHCFEYWMGAYPFYEDGYKLVESPYLGMEHQGAIAYGNKYKMGYKGMDRSWSGHGLKWDYIIIHESGHEWFGNNVTARDMADNWIHEGFTSYTEVLFTECLLGKKKAMEYSRGLWKLIRNDKPVIGDYGVNEEGSGDIYEKGAAIVHMIRAMMNDDERFRAMLGGINAEFYHKTVTTAQIEGYISAKSGIDLKPFFDQYLRHSDIPRLEYAIKNGEISYRFENVVPGFSLPISVTSGDKETTLKVTGDWQSAPWDGGYDVEFSKDFLVKVKK